MSDLKKHFDSSIEAGKMMVDYCFKVRRYVQENYEQHDVTCRLLMQKGYALQNVCSDLERELTLEPTSVQDVNRINGLAARIKRKIDDLEQLLMSIELTTRN